MAGILDKKERIFDFVITDNGRSQIQNNDIRYRYASLSDFSTVYTKKEIESQTFGNRNDISDVDHSNIFLEATTKSNNNLNYELNLSDFVSFSDNSLDSSLRTGADFTDANISQGLSLGESILNLKLLTTKNKLNENASLTFVENEYLTNDLTFSTVSEQYFSVGRQSVNKNNIPVLINDEKFKSKTKYKKLIPVSSQNIPIYEEKDFSKKYNPEEYKSDNSFFKFYKYFNPGLNQNNINEIKTLKNIIKDIENRPDALKRIYQIEKFSNDNNFIFEMFESSQSENNNDLKKIFLIKVGEFYDETKNVIKRVYQAGHIINTRDDLEDSFKELYFFKDTDPNNSNTNLKSFIIDSFYSFVVLFTIVIE